MKELLARSRRKIWSLSDCNWTRTHNLLVRKGTLNYLAKLAKWLSCVVTTYLYSAFDCMFLPGHARVSEWIHTLYSCLNLKELLAQSRHKIWSLSDCNWTRTHNHLVWIHSEMPKWHDKNIQSNAPTRYILTTQLNHLACLAKWLSVRLWTKWLWVRAQLQ